MLAAGAAGAGAVVLAACGSSDKTKPSAAARTEPSTPAASPAAPAARAARGAAKPLAKVADIPVGSAVAAAGPNGESWILAQPAAGTVVAFSARCTHMGCTVAPAGKTLDCPCHGSSYAAGTGQVLQGPAARPLAKVDVHVVAGDVMPGTA